MPARGAVVLETAGDLDTVGTLFDASGERIDQDDDGAEHRNFRIERTLDEGTYYVRVHSYQTETGAYTLHLRGDSSVGRTDEVNFVGVAHNKVATSHDGIRWQVEDIEVRFLQQVAYGDGLWVAVGGGTIVISEDGRNWTQLVSEDPYDRDSDYYQLRGVAHGGGRWTAVGGNTILTSADGRNWSTVYGDDWEDEDPNLYVFTANDVGYGGGLWVAAGVNDIFESRDGRNWRALPYSETGGCSGFTSNVVAFGDGHWYTTGYGGGTLACARTSSGNWARFITGVSRHHGWDIEYGDGDWVAVGNSGIATWGGGANEWYWVELPTGCCVNSVAFRNGLWVVGTGSGPYYNAGDPKQPADWIRVTRSQTGDELLQFRGIASK